MIKLIQYSTRLPNKLKNPTVDNFKFPVRLLIHAAISTSDVKAFLNKSTILTKILILNGNFNLVSFIPENPYKNYSRRSN